jgi:hypothetical protein
MERNFRGLLPIDMNHRAEVIDKFEQKAHLKRFIHSGEEEIKIDGVTLMTKATLKKLTFENNEFDINPDYTFLIKGSWAPILISELMMLNLKVTEIISKFKKKYIFV